MKAGQPEGKHCLFWAKRGGALLTGDEAACGQFLRNQALEILPKQRILWSD